MLSNGVYEFLRMRLFLNDHLSNQGWVCTYNHQHTCSIVQLTAVLHIQQCSQQHHHKLQCSHQQNAAAVGGCCCPCFPIVLGRDVGCPWRGPSLQSLTHILLSPLCLATREFCPPFWPSSAAFISEMIIQTPCWARPSLPSPKHYP